MKKTAILLLLLLVWDFGFTQQTADLSTFNPRFEIFKLPGNLPGTNSNNNVQSIVQDSLGFIWFGTQGGLVRYDGQHFVTYPLDQTGSNTSSTTNVEWICMDKKGVLWLAKSDLVAFDPNTGHTTRYAHDPNNPESLCEGDINMILEDKSGFIWAATSKGLDRLDPNTGRFKHFVYKDDDPKSLSNNIVRALYEDQNGTIWVGCGFPFWPDHPEGLKGGLNRYDPATETFTRYLHDPGDPASISDNRVRAIFEDSRGDFWVGTAGTGLQKMDRKTGKFTRYPFDPAHPGRLAAPVPRKQKGKEPPNDYYHVTFISEDRNGWLWVGTFDGGMNVFDPKTNMLRHFEMAAGMSDSLQTNVLWNFCQTKDGTIWLCSGDAGGIVFRVKSDAQLFPWFDIQHLGVERPVFFPGILKDSASNIWVQMMGRYSGVLRFDPANSKKRRFFEYDPPFKQRPSLTSEDLAFDRRGNLWANTANGFYRMNPNKDDRLQLDTTYSPKTTFEYAGPPFFDKKGNCWVATLGDGLFRFGPDMKLTHFKHSPGDPQSLGGDRVEKVFEDSHGNIWVHGGSGEKDPKNFMFFDRFTADESDNSGSFTHLLPPGELGTAYRAVEDKNGVFWFTAYPSGIRKLNPETGEYKSYTVENGALTVDKIREMVMDNNGKIWMMVLGIILEFDTETEVIRTWSAQHGVQWVVGSPMSGSSVASDGQVLFSGDGIFHAFYPDKISGLAFGAPLPVRLTGLSIRNETVTPEQGGILKKPIWETTEINLPYDQNIFSLQVTNFEFITSDMSRLRFKLENYDPDWRNDLREGEASYVNVPPGDYIFRVKSRNSMGVWGPETQLQITISPPWWRTWLAYLFYFLAVVGGIYALYRNQLNRHLQHAETLRLQELDAVKTRLYTNITHEFRTPLTIILGMAKQVLDDPKEHFRQGMNAIVRNGQTLLTLVNQLLDLSKLESGKLPLHYIQGDVVKFINYLVESFHSLAESKGIQLHFLTDFEEFLMDFDEERLQQILTNLLSNAVKFTPNGGHVYLDVRAEPPSLLTSPAMLILKVKDTGTGIEEAHLPFIFDRFYQADDSHIRRGEGTGIGLALTKELVKLMDGEISVKSTHGKGSEFTVKLPISQSANWQEVEKKGVNWQVPAEVKTTNGKPNTPTTAGKPLVLIAEDNADVVAYVSGCLAADYRLAIAKDGQEAVAMALDLVPDLLVTDVMMPHRDGFEVCNLLKNDERTSHVPIVMLTAKADLDSKIAGLEKGADAYLSKPFEPKELLVHVKSLLNLRQKLQQHYRSKAGLANEENATPPPPVLNELESYFLKKVRKVVESHLDDSTFTVEQMCREVGISHAQLHRKLIALTGLSANLFLRSIRLSKAKELLLKPELSITGVAMDSGFNDASYFGKVFKQEFGMTPNEWRERNLDVV